MWDDYGEMIESVSSKIPWMVGPGNHEIEQIFVSDVDVDGKWNRNENRDKIMSSYNIIFE